MSREYTFSVKTIPNIKMQDQTIYENGEQTIDCHLLENTKLLSDDANQSSSLSPINENEEQTINCHLLENTELTSNNAIQSSSLSHAYDPLSESYNVQMDEQEYEYNDDYLESRLSTVECKCVELEDKMRILGGTIFCRKNELKLNDGYKQELENLKKEHQELKEFYMQELSNFKKGLQELEVPFSNYEQIISNFKDDLNQGIGKIIKDSTSSSSNSDRNVNLSDGSQPANGKNRHNLIKVIIIALLGLLLAIYIKY